VSTGRSSLQFFDGTCDDRHPAVRADEEGVRSRIWQHVSGDEYSMFGSCAALIPVDGEPLLRSDR